MSEPFVVPHLIGRDLLALAQQAVNAVLQETVAPDKAGEATQRALAGLLKDRGAGA